MSAITNNSRRRHIVYYATIMTTPILNHISCITYPHNFWGNGNLLKRGSSSRCPNLSSSWWIPRKAASAAERPPDPEGVLIHQNLFYVAASCRKGLVDPATG